MSFENRKRKIEELQEVRGSKVLCYIMSDRDFDLHPALGFKSQLSTEPTLQIFEHLQSLDKCDNIDIFLYTRGGNTDAVWPLISMLREYSRKLSVLVPFRAHSGGTLICLGADEIVMGPLAELSPIDPTTGNQFNPIDNTNKQARLGISVEDVTAYFDLVRDEHKANLKAPEHILEAFKMLSEKVHPLALGNVNRVYTQIRILGEKLLSLHLDKSKDKKRIEEIINWLTVEFYTHTHYINRKEALEILGSDIVKNPTEEEERCIWALFEEYSDLLDLKTFFSMNSYLGNSQQKDIEVIGAIIESQNMSHLCRTKSKITKKSNIPPNVQVPTTPSALPPLLPGYQVTYDIEVIMRGWVKNKGGV